MLHGFFVEDGKVRYRNRYVRTNKWQVENAAGRALFGTFGNPMTTDPSVLGQDSGVANTNIVWHAGKLMALEEGHMPTELDPVSLETRGYAERYRGNVTAHPKIDPETGEMVWFGYSAGEAPLNPTVAYGVTDAAGEVVRRDNFEAPYTSMVHDFLVTRRHVLFPILPLTGSLERAMRGGPAFAWEPEKGAFVGVMARDAGGGHHPLVRDRGLLRLPPDERLGGRLEDLRRRDGISVRTPVPQCRRQPRSRRSGAPGSLDVRSGRRIERHQARTARRQAGEFPRFDERRAGLAYRHGWFAANTRNPGALHFDAIAHIDLATGKRAIFELPSGDATSEPVFTPRTPDAAEGDGYLLSVVYRGETDRSDLLVFDTADITAGPVATAHVPRRVPFGFHGNWRSA